MTRGVRIAALIAVVLLTTAGCSRTTGGVAGITNPVGERVSLQEARRSTSYPIPLPEFRPEGMGAVASVTRLGRGEDTSVAVVWDDGTLIEFAPVDFPTDYQRTVKLVGAGAVEDLRGGDAYVREPMNTEAQGQMGGFVRWYEAGLKLEITIMGPFPVSTLKKIAESMHF